MLSFPAQNWDAQLAATRASIQSRAPRLVSRITPRLYLSDYLSARDPQKLKKLGITHVVSLIEPVPAIPDVIPEDQRLHFSIIDNPKANILQYLETATGFIIGALEENSTNRVLVHCMQGISRSATVVCAYLVATTDLDGPQSIAHVQNIRPIVCPNSGFREQLDEYARTVVKHKPKSKPRQLQLPGVFKIRTSLASQIRRLKETEVPSLPAKNQNL